MKQITSEIWQMLNGCEVMSLEFEGVVMVDATEKVVIRNGKKLKVTNKQLHTLWDEYVEQEGF